MHEFRVNHKQYAGEGKPVSFSRETLKKIDELIKRYPEGKQKSALLPVLHMAQEELGAYLGVDVMNYVAGLLGIQPVEVYEVATFYTQFWLEKKGRYLIEVCRTGPCAICGGEKISEHLSKRLNIKPGETTSDGLFTLMEVECLGACGNAPVMQVNTEFHEHLTTEKIDRIIDSLSAEKAGDKEDKPVWAEKLF
ncbi:MAG: NAD(P)H-dependent oxidoreductase subunit E [Bacteroidales bacterium]